MTRRVLLTGGAGFIGSHIAERYVEFGFDVTVIDDLSSGRIENMPKGVRFVRCDICSDEARSVAASGFDILNHHAAQMDVRVSVADPRRDARINLDGLLNLLEGARAGGVRRVVFASSGGVVYGESDRLPHPEEAPKLPVSPYGVSKLASEYYLTAYAQLYGLEVVNLRYANVYGPRQNPHGEAGVVAIFSSRVRNGEGLTVYGDGEQTRDYVYAGDVARANLLASTQPVPPLRFLDDVAVNIGTGQEISVNRLVATLLDATGKRAPVRHAPARAGELRRSAVDPARASRVWGWVPEVSLAEGLRRTYDWMSSQAAA
ncbi:MAG: NAD-dependent epimerase/dehydratase family protein [Gemmatimonadetes bacterium]|nr:NAD-dependent epimerase/dehydratase family protein [Gemmatimonadota bacterium]